MNCLHIIPPNHYPESLRQPPDTSQTPSKHPTDTPNLGKFWSSQGHWEKRKQLLRMSLMGCLISACIPFPRYYPKSTPRHLPKPTIKYDIFDQTETRIQLIKMNQFLFYWMFINCLLATPTPTLSRVTHATLRHLSDTFQTPQNTDQLISHHTPKPPPLCLGHKLETSKNHKNRFDQVANSGKQSYWVLLTY